MVLNLFQDYFEQYESYGEAAIDEAQKLECRGRFTNSPPFTTDCEELAYLEGLDDDFCTVVCVQSVRVCRLGLFWLRLRIPHHFPASLVRRKLECTGSVCETREEIKDGKVTEVRRYNVGNCIDGARIIHRNKEGFRILVLHSECPSFYMKIDIPWTKWHAIADKHFARMREEDDRIMEQLLFGGVAVGTS